MRKKLANLACTLLLMTLALVACGSLGGEEEVEVPPRVLQAREIALAFIRGQTGELQPAPDTQWIAENTTPGWPEEPAPAWAGYRFTSEGRGEPWVVTVGYAVLPEEQTIYEVTVASPATGFQWEGQVDAAGRVRFAPEPTPPVSGSQSRRPPEVGTAEMAKLVRGNSVFAFDLYRALRGNEGNLFYSPYSISLALAMTYAGAREETEAQMAGTLHFLLPQEQLHPAFYALDRALASRGEGAAGLDGEGFRLNIVNALWGQAGHGFLPEYLTLLGENYGAGMRWLDFAADAEAARATINDWASEQTEGRIKDLIPAGILDSATRLVLTNAIYFNAAWSHPFEQQQTEDAVFYLLNGGEATVPTMRQTEAFGYASGEGYQVVELPYDGGQLSMIVLLPAEGGFESFESSLSGEGVAAILQDLKPAQVALTMPKFEFESEFSLKQVLQAMGMPAAFSGEADFSGMTGARDLFIDAVLHKAFVAVDEEGTEAAAATAVAMAATAMEREPPIEVRLDRPFLFFIRDIETGAVLFVGRVVDPR